MPWGYGSASHGTVGVLDSTGTVVSANADRKYLLMVNDSDATIYLSLDGAAVVSAGIRLNAGGGNYEMSFQEGNLFTGAVTAIHDAAGTKNLLTTEGV